LKYKKVLEINFHGFEEETKERKKYTSVDCRRSNSVLYDWRVEKERKKY
jgi:hypothetical protein